MAAGMVGSCPQRPPPEFPAAGVLVSMAPHKRERRQLNCSIGGVGCIGLMCRSLDLL